MKQLLIAPIRLYQKAISPLLPPSCCYQPTCSQYMIDAIDKHGVKGVVMGTARICRCHPFAAGGEDPVPDVFQLRKPKS